MSFTVADYLEREGIDEEELARRVGAKPHAVVSRRKVAFPKTWAAKLELELDDVWEDVPPGRANEQTPKPPPGARVVEPPPATPELDFSGLAGYIESAYLMGSQFLVTDELLAAAIAEHAKQAGEAWARWAESDPRIAAWLQKMMVGTPFGEVIAVHVGIGAGYFIARATTNRARADELERQRREAAERGEPVDDLGPVAAVA